MMAQPLVACQSVTRERICSLHMRGRCRQRLGQVARAASTEQRKQRQPSPTRLSVVASELSLWHDAHKSQVRNVFDASVSTPTLQRDSMLSCICMHACRSSWMILKLRWTRKPWTQHRTLQPQRWIPSHLSLHLCLKTISSAIHWWVPVGAH